MGCFGYWQSPTPYRAARDDLVLGSLDFFFRGPFLKEEGVDEVEGDSSEDEGICKVEGWPAITAETEEGKGGQMNVEKVGDVAVHKAVDEVTEDTADQKAERKLKGWSAETELFALKINEGKYCTTEDGEEGALSTEDAPGGSPITDVDQVKPVGNDLDWCELAQCIQKVSTVGYFANDHPFGDLIENKGDGGEEEKDAVGRAWYAFVVGNWIGTGSRCRGRFWRLHGVAHSSMSSSAKLARSSAEVEKIPPRSMRRRWVFSISICPSTE